MDLLQSIDEAAEKATEGAILFDGVLDVQKVQGLRGELLELLRTRNEVHAYCDALQSMAASYAPQLGQNTDFEQGVEALMQQAVSG